jgi:hypothetical protein
VPDIRTRRDAVGYARREFVSMPCSLAVLPMTAGLLDEHVGHCVANAAAAGDQNKARDTVTEATLAIARIKT